jgi:thiol:disulfide interchange protein
MRSLFQHRAVLGLLTLIALLIGTPFVSAQDGTENLLPVTEAYKLSADASTPGVVKLHWTIAPDYYLYRGRMNFKGGDGVTLGTAQLPDGEKHDDPYLGPVETYHHSIDATIPYTLAPGTTHLTLSVRYQGCHETDPKICYPPHTEQLDLPVPGAANAPTNKLGDLLKSPSQLAVGGNGAALPAEQAFHFDAIAQYPHHLLIRWTMAKGYYLYRDKTTLTVKNAPNVALTPAWPAGEMHTDANFGNTTVYFGDITVPVSVNGDLSGLKTLDIAASFQGCQDGGVCYPVMTREASVELGNSANATATKQPAEKITTSTAAGEKSENPSGTTLSVWLLVSALLGGLLLNLMPCVLPVLSLKVIGVLENSHEIRALRKHAVFYTAGVLVSFAIIALISHALGLGLGAQLQNPTVVAVLACVMFGVGLALSGVVHFNLSVANVGHSLAARKGVVGDFFVGVLAVVVASPCTGLFMAGPIGYAMTASLSQSLLLFVLLGLGLALPVMAIAIVPGLSRLLPRPGAWMDTFKQILAFPMYLSAVWLAWVLAKQRGADGIGLLLVAMVLLAMALWWFERTRQSGLLKRAWVVPLALAALLQVYYVSRLPPASTTQTTDVSEGIVAYSPQKLDELRKAGTPVFVDMTADWCVTCKANEHTVLDGDAFQALLKRTGTVYMKGDWTDVNPTISAFLQQYHSPGVPLYVVFPKNGGPGQALPTVLTESLVDDAVSEAAK